MGSINDWKKGKQSRDTFLLTVKEAFKMHFFVSLVNDTALGFKKHIVFVQYLSYRWPFVMAKFDY